jgi:arginase
VTVQDRGDALQEVFVADEMASRARNLAAASGVARTVADAVTGALTDGARPVALGDDCTISLGAVAGAERHDPATGLLYLDGDADLATPATTSRGGLDAMGIANILGMADTELARLGVEGPRAPLDARGTPDRAGSGRGRDSLADVVKAPGTARRSSQR